MATAAEAAALRGRGHGGPILVMGALAAEEADVALDDDADVVVWTRGFLDVDRRRAARACT